MKLISQYLKTYPISFLGMIAILFVCLAPISTNQISTLENFDKWAHFAMFFTLSTAMWVEYVKSQPRHLPISPQILILFFIALVFSFITEYLQELIRIADRKGDVKDLLADGIGVFIGFFTALIYILFRNYRKAILSQMDEDTFLRKMQKRYTIKKYDPQQSIGSKDIEELMETLRLTPSSLNSQPWQFSIITSAQEKELLAPYSMHNGEKVLNASHIIVFGVYKNRELFEKERIHDLTSSAYYQEKIAIRGDENVKNWAIRQIYIALGVLLSAAAHKGIGATPMEGIDTQEWTRILHLENFDVVLAVALGTGAEDDLNKISVSPKKRREANDVWARR